MRGSWKPFAALAAGLALYLQTVLLAALPLAGPADPAADFLGHALCLADAGGGSPMAPSPGEQPAPDTGHHHDLFCCLWHSLPGLQPASAEAASLPAFYAGAVIAVPGVPRLIARTGHNPGNARAPPPIV